jgi:hypothetical protein
MYRLYICLFVIPLLTVHYGDNAWIPPADQVKIDTAAISSDTCRTVTEYVYTHKVMEGMVCRDKREGIWKEWYTDGRIKDSAMYQNGIRLYALKALEHAKGTLIIRGNPKTFYKDSTYECCVKVNTSHGIHDIKGTYSGISDTVYPPLFYFGADMGSQDSFNYYFTPKTTGKYKLRLSLAGDASATADSAPFYERDIEVVRK